MNEFRAAVNKGEVAQMMSPVTDKEKCRRARIEGSETSESTAPTFKPARGGRSKG